MSTQTKRVQRNQWCIDVERKPFMENVVGLIVFGVIVAFGYGTLQMHGANLAVTLGTFGMAGLYLLLLFGQRVTYFRVGDWLELGADPSRRAGREEDADDWQRRNR